MFYLALYLLNKNVMTILDRIINIVNEQGAITLQGIYDEMPDIKKTVIRGTLNRYIYKKDKQIDRLKRGIYVGVSNENNANVLDFKCTKQRKRSSIISEFKYVLQRKQSNIGYNQKMVVGLDGNMSSSEVDLINFTNQNYDEDSIDYSRSQQFNGLMCSDKENGANSNDNEPIEDFDNKIFNEDSRSFLKRIKDNFIDLIICDPPYLTTKRGIGKRTSMGGMLKTDLTCKGKIFEYNSITMKEYIPELFRVLKDGSHCYIMTNQKNLVNMLNEAIGAGFKFIKSLIWKKNNKTSGIFYMSQFEYILFFRKGKAVRINNCGTSDILEVDNKKTRVPQVDDKGKPIIDDKGKIKYRNLHDTEKPVSLMKILVENSSKVMDRVLDPFCGVGAVPIACKELGRTYICNEIDKTYRDISIERVNNASCILNY